MKKRLILLVAVFYSLTVVASGYKVEGIYPTHWWVGMKNPNLQLMVRGMNVRTVKFSIAWPGVRLVKVTKSENNNYAFLDLVISPTARPGKMKIHIVTEEGEGDVLYELKARSKENGKSRILGITAADLIYLIMPDRFANGDPSNDKLQGFREVVNSRDSLKGRHGGDLQGVQQRLDYLHDLGVTAIWLNPVIVNDMVRESFHGYAFTDHYTIDPRLGGNQAYHDLIKAAHAKGMKIIQDAVYNHVGREHFFVQDMPMKDWFNQWPLYQNTSYKDQVLMDPYASAIDKKIMSDGWFTPFMPDLNHRNPFVANFLIQHAIWTVEEFGIDGWRIDTYAYNDLDFMNRCNKALLDEYPQIGIFGETWVHGVPNQSFFMESMYNLKYKSNLPGVTDFQLNMYGIFSALNQPFGWTEGVNRLYLTATNDFVYKDPMKNCIFLDNHDMSRFYSVVNENYDKYKMGIAWLLTFRGIPQLYYGTEILMTGTTSRTDAMVRFDFPGGWPGDASNKFTAAGRTEQENNAFNYVRTLANFRKNSSAIKSGKMMQYVPENGAYVYFRYDNKQTIMCVMNQNDGPVTLNLSRFSERMNGFTKAYDVATGNTFNLEPTLTVGGKYLLVMELRK
ncbi:MAG TPA: glycoside hydrolase family 13 protein [Chitinophagaceae bacterium]|nr:glycoside hydrolase family 13 protein [Chitinophagaceae bacterium]